MKPTPPHEILGVTPENFADPWWRIQHLYRIVDDEGRESPFVPRTEQKNLYDNLWHKNLILKSRQLGFCLAPSTPVLTADLRWVPIADLTPGTEIVAVDEHPPGGRGAARKMRTAVVQGVVRVHRPAFRITFDDGRDVVCTDQHPWLARNSRCLLGWYKIDGGKARLRPGTQVRWVTKPWGEPTLEDAWFSGMLDGEGSFAKARTSGASVNVSQRKGPVWDRLRAYGLTSGYTPRIESDEKKPIRSSKFGRVPVPKLCFTRMDEVFRLIGQTRPTRFTGIRFWEGKELPGKRNGDVGWSTIVSIEPLGEMDLIDLQTSTGTYIANGFVSHNTTFTDLLYLDQVLWAPNQNALIIAHTLDDATKIFRNKILGTYERMPQALKDMAPLRNDKGNELVFKNGSSIAVSVSGRGGTLQFLHVSEAGKIARRFPEKMREIVTGSFEATQKGIIIVESTAEGADGWFYTACTDALRRKQEKKPEAGQEFRLHFYPWHGKQSYRSRDQVDVPPEFEDYFDSLVGEHGIVLDAQQKSWYVQKAKVLQEDIQREHPSYPEEAFAQSVEGVIFARQMKDARTGGRLARVGLRRELPVNTFWDLGGGDQTVVLLHQHYGTEHRFLKCYAAPNQGLAYWWTLLEEWRDASKAHWGRHYLPHDADHRQQGENVRTKKDILIALGMRRDKVTVVPRIQDKSVAVALTRQAFPDYVFDNENCQDLIRALDNYHYRWDEQRGRYSEDPYHDWASDFADALMQHSQGYTIPTRGHRPINAWAENQMPMVTGRGGY